MNSINKNDLVIVFLFFGILLTCLAFYGVTSIMRTPETIAEENVFGNPGDGEDKLCSLFNDAVFKNKNSKAYIEKTKYSIFLSVTDDNVVVGGNEFLFEYYDKDNDYDCIGDYLGENEITEEQLEAIYHNISSIHDTFKARGVEYYIAVIPNSQTVYSEYMPFYCGKISDNTRLGVLDEYLKDKETDYFINLTSVLIANKSEGLLYNNTENSLNAHGAYHAYREVMSRLDPEVREICTIYDDNPQNYYSHITEGRKIARDAGISSFVPNKTVSLDDRLRRTYIQVESSGGYCVTDIRTKYRSQVPVTRRVLIDCSNSWTRIVMMPYFSNTFSEAGYKDGLYYNMQALNAVKPNIVIQFISENELMQLTDKTLSESYKDYKR